MVGWGCCVLQVEAVGVKRVVSVVIANSAHGLGCQLATKTD